MHGRRLKYPDRISSPCELNIGHRNPLLMLVTGNFCPELRSQVCDIHHRFLMRSQSYKNIVDKNFPLLMMDDREPFSVTRVIGEIGEIEKACLWNSSFFAIALIAIFKRKQ